MQRELLEAAFPDHLIRTRPGTHGKALAYVEGPEYIRRLNAVFEADWSFEIVEHSILDSEVVVLGKLRANGVEKSAFGGSSITRNRDTGESVSLADDLKAAATDALKKACSLCGIGLHLYGGDDHSAAPKAAQRPTPVNGDTRKAANGDRLTQRQLSAIWSMGRNLGLGAEAIRSRSLEAFATNPEQLTKAEASSLISEFSQELDNRRVH